MKYANSFHKPKCHTGNTVLYTEPGGGSLEIAGWTRDAIVTQNTHVIDLTGKEDMYYYMATAMDEVSKAFLAYVSPEPAGWLSLPFPDYGTPDNIATPEQWDGIAKTIREILRSGRDVLVACAGGHGRSGLFCAIVGHILGKDTNRSWASPVEHLRKVHCQETVETYSQEKFVYDMLGLDIQITHKYATPATGGGWQSFTACPICGTQSVYVKQLGMCLQCQGKYAGAPEIHNIGDTALPVEHTCTEENCAGIYVADGCRHVVHNRLVSFGFCEECLGTMEEEATEEDEKYIANLDDVFGECAMCSRRSMWGKEYGVCYDCAQEVKEQERADYVHNTITDPYRAIPHHCDEELCLGVVVADGCKHVVHNIEVTDGLCRACQKLIKEDK